MAESGTRALNGLDGRCLKLIALFSMFIDHFGAAVLSYMTDYRGELAFISPLMSHGWGRGLSYVYLGARMVGRLAFPIFCFLLTEGFIHTRDRRKYCLRMLAFALISEIPFDLTLWNGITWEHQNVFFELALGLLTLQALSKAEAYKDVGGRVIQCLTVALGCVAAALLRADYGGYGILLMTVYYLLREKKLPRLLTGSAMALTESLYFTWGAAGLAFVPLYFYNGSRGKGGSKYLFYWFYPAHLLLLLLLRLFVLGIPLKDFG